MVKKVLTNLDSSKVSGPDCIALVVLRNCEPELFYILAKLFNICLQESCFQIVGSSHRWSLYLRMLGKACIAKNYHPVSLLFVVNKVFEKIVKNKIVDHLEKYGFRSCRSTADLLTVVSDRIAWAFSRSRAA